MVIHFARRTPVFNRRQRLILQWSYVQRSKRRCAVPTRTRNTDSVAAVEEDRLNPSCRVVVKREMSHASSTTTSLEEPRDLPKHAQMHLDFFGEPVTFLGLSETDKTVNAMATMDGFLLAAVSKGRSCTGGGDEAGLEVRSAHAAAISWAEVLRFATVWNNDNKTSNGSGGNPEGNNTKQNKSAPMLAVVAVAPLLANAGAAYVKNLDALLKQAKAGVPGLPPIEMFPICENAVSKKDHPLMNPRERMHLRALRHLMDDEHPTALVAYLKLLQICPGDALALSLAMDLAQVLGDKKSALRAAGAVASYWNERRGGLIRPSLPGHSMASSLISLGFAVGGRCEEAELLADRSMYDGKKVCGALATWAQAHIFDSAGRISEGISALANTDGIVNYEGSGLMFFDCRLAGYGARFSLDREERGRGKSAALRIYEANFERVLDYSGYSQGTPWKQPKYQAPLPWKDRTAIDDGDGGKAYSGSSFFGRLWGTKNGSKEKVEKVDYEIIETNDRHAPAIRILGWEPACEDVLTWIPPTPQLLSDATLLLLRFTLNGTISARNARWDNVRKSWMALLDVQREHADGETAPPLKFYPLGRVVASILFPPEKTGGDRVGTGRLALGLHKMGEMLELGNVTSEEEATTAVREPIAERHPGFWLPADEEPRKEWKEIVDHLVSAIDGCGSEDDKGNLELADSRQRFESWDFEARPILEHAIVYAACKSGDTESLCIARAICSNGVTLRSSSPEEWWRYSIVLGLLGDQYGSEDALERSINAGAGQGARA